MTDKIEFSTITADKSRYKERMMLRNAVIKALIDNNESLDLIAKYMQRTEPAIRNSIEIIETFVMQRNKMFAEFCHIIKECEAELMKDFNQFIQTHCSGQIRNKYESNY